jgi:hypothetical protein
MLLSLLLAAACIPLQTCTFWSDGTPQVTPCASPTPTIQWDQNVDFDLAGYDLFWRVAGSGSFGLLQRFPCDFDDLDGDGTLETRWCRGADFAVPLQRYCPGCQPGQDYEFAVTAYDSSGLTSLAYSNVVSVCFSPICAAPGPCN